MNLPEIDLSDFSPEELAEAKRLSEDPGEQALIYLVMNKIPWNLANALTLDEKIVFAKAIARIEDSDFEWSTMKMTRLNGKSVVT
jgi:hypothetical protein